MKKKKRNKNDIIMDTIITVLLLLLVIATLYPVWYVIVASFSSSTELAKNPGFMLWPDTFNVEAYKMVFVHSLFRTGFINSIKILIISLPISLLLTLLTGYLIMHMSDMSRQAPTKSVDMFSSPVSVEASWTSLAASNPTAASAMPIA